MKAENLERKNTEIRDQAHLMDAEGACDIEPTEQEIQEYLSGMGWIAYDINISYDNMQGFWRWNCDIKKLVK